MKQFSAIVPPNTSTKFQNFKTDQIQQQNLLEYLFSKSKMNFPPSKSPAKHKELTIQIDEDFDSVSDMFKDDTPIIKMQELQDQLNYSIFL